MYWHCTEHRLQLLHALLGARTPGSELAISGFIACWIPIRVGKLWDTFGSASCSRMFAPLVPQDMHLCNLAIYVPFDINQYLFFLLGWKDMSYQVTVPVHLGRHLDKSADCKLPHGARLRHTECRRLVRFAQPDSWPESLQKFWISTQQREAERTSCHNKPSVIWHAFLQWTPSAFMTLYDINKATVFQFRQF